MIRSLKGVVSVISRQWFTMRLSWAVVIAKVFEWQNRPIATTSRTL